MSASSVYPEELLQQVQSAGDPQVLHRLLDEARDLPREGYCQRLEMVARHGRAWDELLLERFVPTQRFGFALAENPHLPEWGVEHLGYQLVSKLREGYVVEAETLRRILARLVELGRLPLGGSTFKHLLDIALPTEMGGRVRDAYIRRQAILALLQYPTLSERVLEHLIDCTEAHEASFSAVLAHPSLTTRLRRDLWSLQGKYRHREHILLAAFEDPALASDPEVQHAVHKAMVHAAANPDLLLLLAERAQQEQFPPLFRRLAQTHPGPAGELLDDPKTPVENLTREDLLPLLEGPSAPGRLAALRALSRVGGAPGTAAQAPDSPLPEPRALRR